MKKFLFLAVGLFFMSGCFLRSYIADQQGSSGYKLQQTSNEGRVFKFGKVKQVAVLEVELGNDRDTKVSSAQADYDDASASDAQYSAQSIDNTQSKYDNYDDYSDAGSKAQESGDGAVSYTEYKVEKNDTLQKISQKFYGTTKKWMKLYNENKDVLSSPDKIYPGLVIKVPQK